MPRSLLSLLLSGSRSNAKLLPIAISEKSIIDPKQPGGYSNSNKKATSSSFSASSMETANARSPQSKHMCQKVLVAFGCRCCGNQKRKYFQSPANPKEKPRQAQTKLKPFCKTSYQTQQRKACQEASLKVTLPSKERVSLCHLASLSIFLGKKCWQYKLQKIKAKAISPKHITSTSKNEESHLLKNGIKIQR